MKKIVVLILFIVLGFSTLAWNISPQETVIVEKELETNIDTKDAFKKYKVVEDDDFKMIPKVDVYRRFKYIKEKSIVPFIYKKTTFVESSTVIEENNCGC